MAKAVRQSLVGSESIENVQRDLDQVTAEIKALDEDLRNNRLTKYSELVSRTGKLKGHLAGLTARQYEELIGKKPRPELLVKQRDATTKKIPWELALDQLADELGYHGTRGDERLKGDIERTTRDIKRLAELKEQRNYLINVIDDIQHSAVKKERIKIMGEAPLFPGTETKEEVTLVDGKEYSMRRQHSFWQLYANDKSTARIRYAADARKVITKAAREEIQDIRQERLLQLQRSPRLSKRVPRITPKTPKLR